MHRTQIYIQEDLFTQLKTVSKSLGISISEYIRKSVEASLKNENTDDLNDFFSTLKPMESFKDVDSSEYVESIRAKSRIINE